jgi:gamma-glutamylcyclotransferase (GGCT)/AIG2-like uncharacterized protein YtfP
MRVTVYGTLKTGYSNNRLLAEATKIADVTVDGFKLWNAGFPVAQRSPGESIIGELWDIGDRQDILQRLDRLESEGSMYNREDVVVRFPDGTEEAANMYVGHPSYWNFGESRYITPCPKTDEGHYLWAR